MNSDDLASRIRAGEQVAFEEFRLRYGAGFYRYFRRHGMSDADALDLTGDCVTDIPLKVRDHFRASHTSFDAWVYTLRNHALHDWRRRHRLDTVELDPAKRGGALGGHFGEGASPTEPPNDRNAATAAAVAKLDPLDQEILALRYGGLETPTFTVMAAELQLRYGCRFPEATIRQRHARALARVKAMLQGDPGMAGFFT